MVVFQLAQNVGKRCSTAMIPLAVTADRHHKLAGITSLWLAHRQLSAEKMVAMTHYLPLLAPTQHVMVKRALRREQVLPSRKERRALKHLLPCHTTPIAPAP